MEAVRGQVHLAQTRPLVHGYRGAALVIGEERAFHHSVRSALEQSGFRVHCVKRTHLVALPPEKINPKVIIADVDQGDERNLALITQLASDRRFAGVPIVVTSTQKGQHMKWRTWEAGADAFLARPFRPQGLTQVVRAVLEGKQ